LIVAIATAIAGVIAFLANLSQIGQWIEGSSTPTSAAKTVSNSPSPRYSFRPGDKIVQDHDDPRGCTGDARHAIDQPLTDPNGRPIGTLQLMNSLICNAMWGRFQPASALPAGGLDVTITVHRQSDGIEESYHDRINRVDQPLFTFLLRDDGSCFNVKISIGAPAGVVNSQTPCTR
jgi:hypothetical protein